MRQADPLILKSFASGIATGIIGFVIAIIGPLSGVNALSVDTARDCDDNAIVRCGAATTTELHSKYNDSPYVQSVYSHFGITDWNIANLTNNAVAGKVTKGGRVLVGDKEVATDAMTAGRMNMSGSTAVTSGSATFYKRPPSVSFQQTSLPAFVVLKSDGTFRYAIIASCGNPVTATPTATPEKPTPVTPQPEQPKPAAPPTATATPAITNTNINNNVVNVQQQQQQQQAPQPAPVQTQTQSQPPQVQVQTQFVPVATPVAAQPASLPKTGLSDALYITVLSGIAGSTVHLLYSRRKARQLGV